MSCNFYVYLYLNPLKNNIPFYVGKGTNKRALDHLRRGDTTNLYKTNTISLLRETGHEPIIVMAWEGENENSAYYVEKFLIALFGTKYDGTGILTNMTKGGEGASIGHIVTKESRQKNREWHTGKHLSLETKKKISEANTGRPIKENIKLQLSKTRIGAKNPFFGKHHAEEVRTKMSESQKGNKNPFFGKKHSEATKEKIRKSWIIRRQHSTSTVALVDAS
jgi:group I intron endonuclease